MDIINYTSGGSLFNKKTSVLLDACFLLALYDPNDSKNGICTKIINDLKISETSIYVSTTVTSEVVNKLISQLYKNDMEYKIAGIGGINSNSTINKLHSLYTTKEKKFLRNKVRSRDIRRVNYNKILNDTYKHERLSKYLKVYIEGANNMLNHLIMNYNIKYISVSKATFLNAQRYMSEYILGVNDAIHFASAEQANLTYLITLDKDFMRVNGSSKVKLIKI